ncbi:MAG: RtcB family protein [Prochloraceae cyanobacterium]
MPYEDLKLSTAKPVLSWANHDLGNNEQQMARNVASLPFVFKHVALMPDVHLGKGALVGSVIATKDAIIPAAVGVDIGCGMAAIKMPYRGDRLEGKLKKIRQDIEANIPVGFNQNKEVEKAVTNWQGWRDFKELHPGVQRLDDKAMKQLGSLGGGNHFIELCLDTDNQIWLMLHSGSRNIGNQLAQCHIKTGKELAKLASIKLPDRDLAYFVAGTKEFEAYWRDLQWAQKYARFNRDVMMARFKRIVEKHLGGGKLTKPLLSVNCHHNYAEKEVHFGEDVYVTRKGAVRAREEDYGIIPGSMGAKSYIVKGKGNHDSYCSCFAGDTKVLTEFGLMSIADVYRSSNPIELISYNESLQKFESKKVLDKSVRLAQTNKYSVSQTEDNLSNFLVCTPNHPFATYNNLGELCYKSVEELTAIGGDGILPTRINLVSSLSVAEQDSDFYYFLGNNILSQADRSVSEKAEKILPSLPNILLANPFLALYFIAGLLDRNGSHNNDKLSIFVAEKQVLNFAICALLSLGSTYGVSKDENGYLIEFSNNNLLHKFKSICKQERITARIDLDLNLKSSIEPSLAKNRLFKIAADREIEVYNFTVEDNHNYIVFSELYTPLLVHNCSHGAGRLMSRSKAKKQFNLQDVIEQTKGVECRKDVGIIDEIPAAYKPIEEVMESQSDLVEVVATLKQVICVKG